MVEKLEQKNSSNKEQELLLADLMNLIKKFQNQLNVNFQEDLIKISSNKTNSDLLLKLSINNKHNVNTSAIGKNNSLKIKNRLN
jgi:galactose-1-phosphate uridylyltransferase